mmetsp:Transcript_25602/g.35894  ORF Transcript_25602/g.35894 Transcript_25602/m.35894 type:complete len:383 (-) Transcript_25602:224-1372(-)
MGTDTPYGQHLSPYYMMYGDDEQGQEALLIEIEMDDTHTTTDHNKISSLSSSDMIMKSTEQNKKKGILRQLQSNTINKSNIFNNKNGRTHNPKTSTKKARNNSTMRMVLLLSTEKYNRHTSDADLSQQMLCTALSNTSKSNEDNIVKEEIIVSALQNVSNEDNMFALQQNARWLLSQAEQQRVEKHQQQPQRYPRIMKKHSKNRKNTNSDQEDSSLLIFRPGSTHLARRWIDRKRSQKKKKSNKTKDKKSKWQSAIDPQSGQPYYYHRFSKKTTWTKPSDFDHNRNYNPPIVEWTTQMDMKTGRMCYTNLTTNETTFTRPGNDSSDDQHDNKLSLPSEMMTNSTSSSSSVMIKDFSDDDGYYSDEVSNSDGLVGAFDGMVVF